TGTTNQINVSSSTGNITLSLPQDIHTDATPTFNSIILDNLSTGTDNTVLIVDGSGNVVTDEIDSRVWGNTLLDTSHIGVTVQGFDSQLSDISGLTPTDGGF